VTESAVIGVPDEVKGEAIWCFVVANGEVSSRSLGRAVGARGRASGQGVPAGARGRGPRAAADALGEDPSAGDPRDGRGRGSGDLSSLENPSSLASIRAALG
jgi:hypothetical protein